ncbi:hypothetical protein [Phaeobacter gallaeciensis]|uniref:hypothetical protein n=1 Tax=Phaeobacter gallaeciensis TaxID=60890 RepID=UPI00237F2805|nr:hypothetical protein [Phaeobacter gallaeciensis]MDE4063810.1 hypothetical protein [Phaeobacter gallaeciensis]MDE4126836.1 hypothetical protein [Phaeobacter gallaeciensis]MDE4130699.1 hypothetical protein [Phaeobacter gallaeciensis]
MTRQRPQTFTDVIHDPLDELAASKPKPARERVSESEAQRLAAESGFTPRGVAFVKSFDARSLRSTDRTAQLNISVRPETKRRFWQFAHEHGFKAGEDALVALLEMGSPTKDVNGPAE